MRPIIHIDGLGKRYRLGAAAAPYRTLRESVAEAARTPLRWLRGGRVGPAEHIWALRDVSLDVYPGEAVGIIGRNGAGKSTLLKVLARITEPTAGRVDLYGRMASLLEVGTGFHPELTGRENILLSGALLGMRRREIRAKLGSIVEFAGVSKFLDTPVKHYSSGMYMRLAFAVAAHLETEILLVDEVLAVGDAEFQKKCLGRMRDVARRGRTVLFVSHNMPAVQTMCQRAVWLRAGSVAADGPPHATIDAYLAAGTRPETDRAWPTPADAPGNDAVRLAAVRLVPPDDCPPQSLTVHTSFRLEFDYWVRQPGLILNLSLFFYTQDGTCAFNVTSHQPDRPAEELCPGLFRTACAVPGDLLNCGRYTVSVLFAHDSAVAVWRCDDAITFDVGDSHRDRGNWYGPWPGAVRPRLAWQTARLGPENGGAEGVATATAGTAAS